MTEDDIIRMAWKTGLVIDGNNSGNDDLVAFANLVAEQEREACAKVCEDASGTGQIISCKSAADAIRAREHHDQR